MNPDKEALIIANFLEYLNSKADNPVSYKEIARRIGVSENFIYNITARRRSKPIPLAILNKLRIEFYDEGNDYIEGQNPDKDLIAEKILTESKALSELHIRLTNQLLKQIEINQELLKENKELKARIKSLEAGQ